MNLSYVSPLPPLRTGVADYSASLLPRLRPHFERIVAVVDGYEPDLAGGLVDEVIDVSHSPAKPSALDGIPLYHVGCNTRYHAYVCRALRCLPGVTVLHDGNLLPLVHELTVARGDRAAFLREASYERGLGGVADGWRALREGRTLSPARYPMLGRVARSSLGVVVHSRTLSRRILDAYPGARVTTIPHLDLMAGEDYATTKHDARADLGIDPRGPVVGALGFIAPSKRLDVALQAFAALRDDFPGVQFVCIGEAVAGYRFDGIIRRLGLVGAVRVTGYVPAGLLPCYLSCLDVAVNLRSSTWGESSGALIRLMRFGIPTLVTNDGAFAELPDEAVVKVPYGREVVHAVEAALRDLLTNPTRRARIAAAARSYVDTECDPRQVAERYVAFIRDIVRDGRRMVVAGRPS